MKQRTLTFAGLDKAYWTEQDLLVPPGHRIITMEMTTISPGTELGGVRSGRPNQPGYIMTGRDEQGQRCFVFPTMAESSGAHCNIRALSPQTLLLPLPEDLPLESAGFLRFINIGMHAYNKHDVLPTSMAVIGLGPVGNIAAQIGRVLGCEVIGVDPSPTRRDIANACGISTTLSPDEFGQLDSTLDFVIDTVAGSTTLPAAAKALKEGGTCSMVGIIKDGPLSAHALCKQIWNKNLLFHSGWEMKNPVMLTERNLQRGVRWLLDGRIHITPLLSGIIKADLDAIATAYQKLSKDPENNVCYAIDWR
jgi:threonine dehydrogenase-like Zn-dependent dehydrogenase